MSHVYLGDTLLLEEGAFNLDATVEDPFSLEEGE